MNPKEKGNKKAVKKDINVLYFDKQEEKKINQKRIIGITILLIIIISILTIYLIYANNVEFRKYMDENILNKNIETSDLKSIEINDYDKSHIFAYSRYVAILKDNTLKTYNDKGNQEKELTIQITTPIVESTDKYLVLAEQNSSKIYMLEDTSLVWTKDLEGNISRITVNENGYVAVVLSGTTYKSVIIVFDDKGTELFKTYLSTTMATSISISNNNKYLSYAEVNTSGTLIKSNIKTISIEKAKQTPIDSIINTYNAEFNNLIVDIKYQNNNLICMYDEAIHRIKNNTDEKIIDINADTEQTTFSTILLQKDAVKNIESNSGLLSTKTTIKIINTENLKENVYQFEGVTKELYSKGNKIALNLGSEVHFIDTNGWLIKKYNSSTEIRKIVLSNEISGIIYRDRIEIIKF